MPCTLPVVFTIIGQKKAIDVLVRSHNDNRRHHAWIFSGPKGVGKYTAAIQFAQIILDIGGDKSVSHPDLHVIKKEDVVWSQNTSLQKKKQTNIPMDLLRERMIGGKTSDDRNHESVAFKTPVLAKEKVFIIDEAELLDESAQNILLKTLEEPPTDTTIILVTSREDRLLPTITSRCQQIGFSPLSEEDLCQWIEENKFEVSQADLEWAISFSAGSPGLLHESINVKLPGLARSISSFLSSPKNMDYSQVSSLIISFLESYIDKKLLENSNASKESLNHSGVELVLKIFGLASQEMVRSGRVSNGCAAAIVIADIEQQLSTNISIKVLLESLVARWAYLCFGDSLLSQA